MVSHENLNAVEFIDEELPIDFIESVFKDVSISSKNITKYFSKSNFNLYLFKLINENRSDEIEFFVLNIFECLIRECKIDSKLLIFNIIESIDRNLSTTETPTKTQSISERIMLEIVSNCDLSTISVDHHGTIARFLVNYLLKSTKSENGTFETKIIEKFVDILWKFEKKNTTELVEILAEYLSLENDDKIVLYVETINLLLNVRNLSLKSERNAFRNLSIFIFNSLQTKSIQRSDRLMEKILVLCGLLLTIFDIDWIESNNSSCKYNDETFLRRFYLLFSSLSSFVLTDCSESKENESNFIKSIEILLNYLKFINEQTDQPFSGESELILSAILSRVNENFDFMTNFLREINSNIFDRSKEEEILSGKIFDFIRSVWIESVLLGKETTVFVDNCGRILSFIVEKGESVLCVDKCVCLDEKSVLNEDELIIKELFVSFPSLTLDFLFHCVDESFIYPFLSSLFRFFQKAFGLIGVLKEENRIMVEGLTNFINLVSQSLTIVDDPEYFLLVSSLIETVDSDYKHFSFKKLRIAIARFFLHLFTHPTIEETVNEERIDMIVLLLIECENNDELKVTLVEMFQSFFDRYPSLKRVFNEKLKHSNCNLKSFNI